MRDRSATGAGGVTPTIRLGFEVGSGLPVEIPIGHMAVTGQTQQAGKTTALEALAARSDWPVLAFRTKRGESVFEHCRPHLPIFRDRADWEYVSAILEATLRERLKFERGWIMRASKGAKTLKDVHQNVKHLMLSAKGLSADVYYQLDTYLDKVVPQIDRLKARFTGELGLVRGINVIDLSAMSPELQALVITSALEWIYQHATKTITIIPEAWEFLPRQRRSPVALAAEALVRKGAALKNFLWIDSQDLSGVHTPILKQISIWLLGVQREINEAKRTIAHVHAQKKPKVQDVAGLGLGQFIACFRDQAIKTYVQPAWAEAEAAERAAKGEIAGGVVWPYKTSGTIAYPSTAPADLTGVYEKVRLPITRVEDLVTKDEAQRLEAENRRLRQEIADLQTRLRESTESFDMVVRAAGPHMPPVPEASAATPSNGSPVDLDAIYEHVIQRVLQDQGMLRRLAKIATTQPEILITTTPKVIHFDGSSPRGRLAKMIADGLLDQPSKPDVIIKEFDRTGSQVHPSRLSEYLSDFLQHGFIVRGEDANTYQKAPGLKITKQQLETVEV